MTRVYCTKKLKDFIGNVDETLPLDCNDIKISDWNAHLFYVDKRKCIVFVNILTYYSVFIVDIVKKDVKSMDEIFLKRLNVQLIQDNILIDLKNTKILTDGATINFIKTNNNKKVIGIINNFVSVFKHHRYYKYDTLKEMQVVYENGLINSIPTGQYEANKNKWSSPIDNVQSRLNSDI